MKEEYILIYITLLGELLSLLVNFFELSVFASSSKIYFNSQDNYTEF